MAQSIKSRLINNWPYYLAMVAVAFSLGSLYFFEYKSKQELAKINDRLSGEVAGITSPNVTDISSKDLALIPGGELLSFDTQNNKTSYLIEVDKSDSEIKNFYDDYLFENNWVMQNDGSYQKEEQVLLLTIADGVIKVTITQN